MTYERFHTVCDKCGSKGAEYLAHTIPCRECGDDTCAQCAAQYDEAPPGYAMCRACSESTTEVAR